MSGWHRAVSTATAVICVLLSVPQEPALAIPVKSPGRDFAGGPKGPAEGVGKSKIPIVVDVPPTVLVPGIGGSIMAEPKSGLRVWIRFYEAEYYFKRFMWGRYNATSASLEPRDKQFSIEPLLTGYGLDAIRNLDPSVHWPIYDYVSYFDSIIQVLENSGWIPGLNLFGVPWDWRQSMCWPSTLDRLRDTILRAQRLSKGRKVKLVSHSMGGLVIKCFIATFPEIFESAVDSWVAIATPYRGAGAKIYMELLQGYNLGNIVIAAQAAKGLSMEAPAVYELLPTENFNFTLPPYIAVTINGTSYRFTTSGAQRYSQVLRDANVNYTVVWPDSGEVIKQAFNDDCWALSQATRAKVESAVLPDSVSLYNVYGVGEPTTVGLDFGEGKVWEDMQTMKYHETAVDGDGTVPTESAVAHGMKVKASKSVMSSHMGMLMQKEVLVFMLDALYGRL